MVAMPRKIFTVLIHNKEYDVYSIDGKEHGGDALSNQNIYRFRK